MIAIVYVCKTQSIPYFRVTNVKETRMLPSPPERMPQHLNSITLAGTIHALLLYAKNVRLLLITPDIRADACSYGNNSCKIY